MEELAVDVVITAAIVVGLMVVFNASLVEVLTGPIFIVIVAAGFIHIGYKYVKRRRDNLRRP